MVSFFYIRYYIQDTKATRRDFFVFYIAFIIFIVRIYEYVLFVKKPQYIEEICDLRNDRNACKEWIAEYFIYLWVTNLILNIYFAYVLMQFKNEPPGEDYKENEPIRPGWRELEKKENFRPVNSLYLPVTSADLD